MNYQGKKNKFGINGKLYSDRKIKCADIHCNNLILIPSYGLDPRSKQRFCTLCRKTKLRRGSRNMIIWKCTYDDCNNFLNTPEFPLLRIKCNKCKNRR